MAENLRLAPTSLTGRSSASSCPCPGKDSEYRATVLPAGGSQMNPIAICFVVLTAVLVIPVVVGLRDREGACCPSRLGSRLAARPVHTLPLWTACRSRRSTGPAHPPSLRSGGHSSPKQKRRPSGPPFSL